MKTNFKMDKRVAEIVEEAKRENLETRNLEIVTSDSLLLQVLLDENSKLTLYMIEEGYFMTERVKQWLNQKTVCNQWNNPTYLNIGYQLFQIDMLEYYEIFKILFIEEFLDFYENKKKEEQYSEAVKRILHYADRVALINGKSEIDEDALIVALVQDENPIWNILFCSNPEYRVELRKRFSIEKYQKNSM